MPNETNISLPAAAFSRTPCETELVSDIKDQIAWLRHYLEHYSKHQQVLDERGHVVNSFTGVVIPDWAVKQKIDSLQCSLASNAPERVDGCVITSITGTITAHVSENFTLHSQGSPDGETPQAKDIS